MARRAPPADRADWTFGQLIDFHLAQGTRPTGRPDVPGKYWSNKDFADHTGVTEKTVRNWRRDRNLPNDLVSIERELFGQNELFAAYRAELREAHRTAQPSDQSPARSGHQIVHLPYSTLGSLFKGRVGLIAGLRERLLQQTGSPFACTALYGLGGVGKTRAAVEYAWAYGESYPAIFFSCQPIRRRCSRTTCPP